MHIALSSVHFRLMDELREWVGGFIEPTVEQFNTAGISQLSERWRKVLPPPSLGQLTDPSSVVMGNIFISLGIRYKLIL